MQHYAVMNVLFIMNIFEHFNLRLFILSKFVYKWIFKGKKRETPKVPANCVYIVQQ